MADERPDLRIGTAEREQALNLLGEHFAAGRLTASEFDERSAAVAAAVTRGELAPLFADLPDSPSASFSGPSLVKASDSPAGSDRAPAGRPSSTPAPRESNWDWRAAAAGITPIVALILFFTLGSWLWFLLVPAVGAALYAGDKGERRNRRRDRD